MSQNTISNEQIYELLKEFKADTNRRFEQIDKRFEQLENRVGHMDQRLSRMETDVRDMMLSRDKVQVQFTRAWAGASVFIGFFAAFFAVIAAKVVIL